MDMICASEIRHKDDERNMSQGCINARQVFIKHEKQIIGYANNIITLLSKASRNQLVDDTKDEASKIIASCETFLSILENT